MGIVQYMTRKKTSRWLLNLSLGFLSVISPIAYGAGTTESKASQVAKPTKSSEIDSSIDALKKTGRGFSAVANRSIPAVVYIKTEYRTTGERYGQEMQGGPFDMFNDEFFQRFFGLPPRRDREEGRSRQPQMAQGSGFIIAEDGFIITNDHVVRDAERITVVLNDGREFEAKIVGQDSHTDLAVIKIEEKDLPFISFGDSDNLDIGEWVIAIGNPFSLQLQATLTVGVVSAKGRNVDLGNIADFIQTDAAINQGNSGGPLLNLDGEVIGINTAIASTNGGYVGIGFAIPSNIAKRVTDKLISKGNIEHGFLGVIMQPLQGELGEYYKEEYKLETPKGALVKEVLKGSPAEKAGIQQQDIIVQLDGKPVENIHSLSKYIKLLDPGTSVKIIVNRKGKLVNTEVKLGTSPTLAISSKVADKLGLKVTELTEELAQRLNYTTDEGVLVERVESNSPAGRSRSIRRGCLIQGVNQRKVTNVKEFNEAIEEAAKGGKRVLLTLKDGENSYFVALKFE
ncbi:MAG: serine peptidase [Chlamydiales bacterium]|jgi:serine protease Do|nr:serine peptidase [Chlamydiales bacterium]